MKRKTLPRQGEWASMKKTALLLLLIALLCTACGQTPAISEEPTPEPTPDATEQAAVTATTAPETEDHVLLTRNAPLADGRVLTLEAVGKALDEYYYGVREVQVYDGDTLLQTISVRSSIEAEWGDGMVADFYDYTSCPSQGVSMEVLDLNFDGNTDFGLFGWPANNTTPYYYWQWDGEQYQYAFILQGAEVHPETGEVSSEYKYGWGGAHYQEAHYQTDYYRPDGDGILYLVRQVRACSGFPNEDGDRGFATEIWVPREGEVIRPPAGEDNNGDKLVLIRREIPVYEVSEDHIVSRFTEIWELKDGQLQLTSRDEYVG